MFGLDIATLTGLAQLLFNGLAVLVIIFLYIRDRNNRQKEYEEDKKAERERTDRLNENYHSIIQDIVQGVSTKHLTPKEGKSIAQIEQQITEIINIILRETNASRVCIVKYHNGNKDMTGRSFLKMSMTNEAVNIGVASMMGEFKDLFRSLLAYWCHKIESNEYCLIKDTEELKNKDITMYQYLAQRNIEAKYGVGLKDNQGDIIGFICIEYLKKEDLDINKINKSMRTHFPKIEALISLDGGMNNEL